MDVESLRRYCLSFPHATEDIQWESDLLFRVGGKIFAGTGLDTSKPGVFLKCTPEEFAELTEREGIVPSPYVARYHWISVKDLDALTEAELKRLIADSYRMVLAKLPKKMREKFGATK
jgi:predicted DNA-binding protein (MmcQ/YjbR family)